MSRTDALREKSETDLHLQVRQLEEQLFKLRFQRATGSMENVMKMRQVRRDIARAKTVLRERELAEASK
ncbi:MAG: 50S ribosomal protein L29 [Thermoanaerobaculia bacterium]